MIVLASAFGTFMLFLLAGLVALPVAVLLDRFMGKERALLLYALVVLGLTALVQCSPETLRVAQRAYPLRGVPTEAADLTDAVFAFRAPDLTADPLERNPFQKHSDTRPLPPVDLREPDWIPLSFALPPTVPGPAPGARRLLRGSLPTLAPGDGSAIPEVPDPEFADYPPTPDDVYDSFLEGGQKAHAYILALVEDDRRYEEGDEGYEQRKWRLAWMQSDWQDLQVVYALVQDPQSKLDRASVVRWRRRNVTTVPADQYDAWSLRRTVDNLYVEALRRHRLLPDPARSTNLTDLRAAAAEMAEVGRTGKEDGGGWHRAAALLETARTVARERGSVADLSGVLEELVAAYRGMRDEQAVLQVLAEYARANGRRPEPWTWLGDLYLHALHLPREAIEAYRGALGRDDRHREARLGQGDALTALGLHREALAAYRGAGDSREPGRDPEVAVRVAEALLRLGDLDAAAETADRALEQRPEDPRGLLLRGAIHYAAGELEEARAAFASSAAVTGPEGLTWRAQACYGLGLVCWRLEQGDAALAAWDACEEALRSGSSPGRFPDETVSPALGRALFALSSGSEASLRENFQRARQEAPQVAYLEVLAGLVAADDENHAAVVRAMGRAHRLVGRYPELDGWLAYAHLRLGEAALSAGIPPQEAAGDFEAAAAFARRAAREEGFGHPDAFLMHVREAWILRGAQHLSARQRFQACRDAAERVLERADPGYREQPAARAMRGYANYRLGAFMPELYDKCLNDFEEVLEVVPDADGPWKGWRDYAVYALGAIKHWRSLEEKTVTFEGSPPWEDWEPADESQGVRVTAEEGVLRIQGTARSDGALLEPTFLLRSVKLFDVPRFEEVRFLLRIPPRDRDGTTVNNVTFGVQVQQAARSARLDRQAGIGIFWQKGWTAVRVGTGKDEEFRDGTIHRLQPPREWPSEGYVGVRIVREDHLEGGMALYLDTDPFDELDPTEPLLRDELNQFKETTRGSAEFWIGGFGTLAQPFLVEIRDIRVVRRR